MSLYRRAWLPGGTWFFTVNLRRRRENRMLIEKIHLLRSAFRTVQQRHPFDIEAAVILPDHLHCVWTLPPGDTDFPKRWSLIKSYFSRHMPRNERIDPSRLSKKERGIWQRRYWEHRIRDDQDFIRHVDYIHWNPVKHGYVECAADWPYSTFHDWVRHGIYHEAWGGHGPPNVEAGEKY
jgi:putative transposase